MYLQGYITIDPSQLTNLHRVKPTRGFAKIAHILSRGRLSPQEEQETFSALAILQQMNVVLRSLGIDNVIRLSKDDILIYEDTEGKSDDLKHAIEAFGATAQSDEIGLFETIDLLLEHHTHDFAYLIDIGIDRTHHVGEHPIHLNVNAMPRKLAHALNDDQEELSRTFASQETYDAFIARQKQLFAEFLEVLTSAFKQQMNVDEIFVESRIKIVRPPTRVNDSSAVPSRSEYLHDPVFYDYPDVNSNFAYAWSWADLCYTNDIQCHDCTIVDSAGANVFAIGEEGFQASAGATMNVDEPFCLPEDTNIEYYGEHESSAEITHAGISEFHGTIGTSDNTSHSWLNFFDGFSIDFGNFGGGDGAGCSGGGCGGCGGGGCGGG